MNADLEKRTADRDLLYHWGLRSYKTAERCPSCGGKSYKRDPVSGVCLECRMVEKGKVEVRTERRAIGIEREPEHFDSAVSRIEAELKRTELFEPPPQIVQRSLLGDSA